MPRLTEQILILMILGKEYFAELGDLLNNPYQYGSILSKSDRSVRRALSRMVARDEIHRQGRRERALYRVRKVGRERVRELRPYMTRPKAAPGEWDGKWRIVMFDIPERYRGMRAVLRRFLKSHGFTSFQRSLWVTPFNVSREVRTFLKASRLNEMAYLMEVGKVYGISHSEFASSVWRLESLSEKYDALGDECNKSEKITGSLRNKFTRLIFSDPLLPSELLPKVFGRGKAMKSYKDLIKRSNP